MDGRAIGETTYASNGTAVQYMRYAFDENDSVIGFSLWSGGWQHYYFVKNLQGDVVKVYKASDNTLVASYTYDSWGNVLSATGELATINPFRYRGYYYDNESWFYYLNSRYYDPAIGRFINADDASLIGANGEFISYNLFAYCLNDPVNRSDADGNWSLPNWAKVVIGVGVIAAAVAVTVATGGAATGTILAAVHCAAAGAAQGAVAGAVSGAVSGAVGGAISHRLKTGSWDGAGQAALDGAATGFMTGAITGAITGAATSNQCFVAGTAVLTAIGAIAIENIRPGDMVWAWDEETGEVALKEVVETYVNETDELVHIHVNGEEIICTPSHPFYSPVKGWTSAVHLRAGDILVLVNGEYVVVEWVQHELLESPIKVYNFQVADYHTYYISTGVLVHNRCGPENLSPEGSGRSGAFNQAKRDMGIPSSQQPNQVLPNVNRKGKVVPGRVYDFGNGNLIRDDVTGHMFSDGTYLGPHFNTPNGGHYFYR